MSPDEIRKNKKLIGQFNPSNPDDMKKNCVDRGNNFEDSMMYVVRGEISFCS
jgi:hypothetical protein